MGSEMPTALSCVWFDSKCPFFWGGEGRKKAKGWKIRGKQAPHMQQNGLGEWAVPEQFDSKNTENMQTHRRTAVRVLMPHLLTN